MHNRSLMWARGRSSLRFRRRRNKRNSCLNRDPHLGGSMMVLGSELERLSGCFRKGIDGRGDGGGARGISVRVHDMFALVHALLLS